MNVTEMKTTIDSAIASGLVSSDESATLLTNAVAQGPDWLRQKLRSRSHAKSEHVRLERRGEAMARREAELAAVAPTKVTTSPLSASVRPSATAELDAETAAWKAEFAANQTTKRSAPVRVSASTAPTSTGPNGKNPSPAIKQSDVNSPAMPDVSQKMIDDAVLDAAYAKVGVSREIAAQLGLTVNEEAPDLTVTPELVADLARLGTTVEKYREMMASGGVATKTDATGRVVYTLNVGR